MSLIIHMRIPGAIVVASDKRVVGCERDELGSYRIVKTNYEQKTFLVNDCLAVSYCGNANIDGYPTSYYLCSAARGLSGFHTTYEVADYYIRLLSMLDVGKRPSLLISGYNNGVWSTLEVTGNDLKLVDHVTKHDTFGPVYHGSIDVFNAIISLDEYDFSLFRLQDAIEFCDLAITTTARVQALRKKPQTVSREYDMMVIMEDSVKWVTQPENSRHWGLG